MRLLAAIAVLLAGAGLAVALDGPGPRGHGSGASGVSSTSGPCRTSARLAEQSTSGRRACGVIRLALSRTTTPADGGTVYTYRTATGARLYVASPPADFNGLTATRAQRVRYGVPPAPPRADAAAYRDWARRVRHWRINPGMGIPEYLYGASLGFGVKGGCSGCWAGYGNTANGWTLASASYTEPAAGPSRCRSGVVSFWSGIGGYGSDAMGQTGTAIGEDGWPNGAAWVETDPARNPPYRYPGNPVAPPGAPVKAITTYNGRYYQFTIYIGSKTYSIGYSGSWTRSDATAEAIVEHVVGTNIANFGTLRMVGLNGNAYSPIAANPYQRWPSSGVTVSPLSGADFSVTQHNCHS